MNSLTSLNGLTQASDLLSAQSYGSYDGYGCCDNGVDFASLLALLAGNFQSHKSRFMKCFFPVAE